MTNKYTELVWSGFLSQRGNKSAGSAPPPPMPPLLTRQLCCVPRLHYEGTGVSGAEGRDAIYETTPEEVILAHRREILHGCGYPLSLGSH